jgi:ubiquitin-protein ligase
VQGGIFFEYEEEVLMNIKGMFNPKKNGPSESPQDRELRMQQRQYDYSRILKLFQTHSYISIKEVVGTPPEKYYITYHVDGLTQTGKSIEAQSEHTAEIILPEKYPNEPPKARMMTALYHPNVSIDNIDLKKIWTRETALADCIVRIGELIAFQRYDTDEPLNGEAAQWALRNKSLLPLSDVDLGYTESEEKFNAFMETKTDIAAPGKEQESDAEKTKAFDNEDEVTEAKAELNPASDTIATIQEEVVTPPLEISQDQDNGGTAAVEPEKPAPKEEIKKENDRRDSPMPAKIDGVKNFELGTEKILHGPVSAQITIDDDSTMHSQSPKSIIPHPYMQSRYTQTPGGPYCTHCGSHVDEYANFCARCGGKLKIKSSSRIARVFFIVGMIAIPIIIFEVGSVIFLLNKKMSPSAPAAEMLETQASQPAATPVEPVREKKTVVKMEPAPAPIAPKAPPVLTQDAQKPISAKVETPKHAPAAIEAAKPVLARPEAPRSAPAVVETPKQSPAKAEAPKPVPAAAQTPKPAPVAAEIPKPAPVVAAEAPKPVPVAAEAPKPAPAPTEASTPIAGTAKKRAAVDGYLSQSESAPGGATPGTTQPPEIAKNGSANQSAVTDNLKLAKLYMGIGSYDDAIARYRDVVKVDPYNQEAIQGLMQAKKMKNAMSGAK